MDITKLKSNECIHCPTKSEALEICKLMDELGLRWNTDESYLDFNEWESDRENTCYYPWWGMHQNLKEAVLDKDTIYPASIFLTNKNEKK